MFSLDILNRLFWEVSRQTIEYPSRVFTLWKEKRTWREGFQEGASFFFWFTKRMQLMSKLKCLVGKPTYKTFAPQICHYNVKRKSFYKLWAVSCIFHSIPWKISPCHFLVAKTNPREMHSKSWVMITNLREIYWSHCSQKVNPSKKIIHFRYHLMSLIDHSRIMEAR